MTDRDQDDDALQREQREVAYNQARVMFALGNQEPLFERMKAALESRDRETLLVLLDELPAASFRDSTSLGINMVAVMATRRLLRHEPRWIALRDSLVQVYRSVQQEVATQISHHGQRHVVEMICELSISELIGSVPQEKIET